MLCLLALAALAARSAGQLSPEGRYTRPYSVRTLAGVAPGYLDGSGTAVRFNHPNAVATDSAGNVYVADAANDVIRRVAANGTTTTIAGTPGMAGSEDGPSGIAQFNVPCGLAVDSGGNIYVADSENSTIRRISPAGVVSTIAGSVGVFGYADGVGSAAQFGGLTGLTLGPGGNLFVSDANGTVRKVTPQGVVVTLAGHPGATTPLDGNGTAAQFVTPCGIAADPQGNLFVLDLAGYLRKVTPAGAVTTVAVLSGTALGASIGGGGTTGEGRGIAVDANDNCFIPYPFEYEVVRVDATGSISVLAGGSPGSADGLGTAAEFNEPTGVALSSSGNLVVADQLNQEIRVITPTGEVSTLAGAAPFGWVNGLGQAARFTAPTGVAVNAAGDLFVADTYSYTVRKIDPSGTVTTLAGNPGVYGDANGMGSAAEFDNPHSVAVDANGNVFVGEIADIRKVAPDGSVTAFAGLPGAPGLADGVGPAARFNYPGRMAFDNNGNLWVCDTDNGVVRRITPLGAVTTVPIPWPESCSPTGICFDAQQNVYIADSENEVIYKYAPGGPLTILAGQYGISGYTDGPGAGALFDQPTDLGTDQAGFIYVADANNEVVRRIAPDGTVSTVAGAAGIIGSADGIGYAARFNGYDASFAVASDPSGNIYVGDWGNCTVRKGVPAAVELPTAWLSNFSALGLVMPAANGAQSLVVGFVTAGPFPKELLIRGIGPGLQSFGVLGALADPALTLFEDGSAGSMLTSWNSSIGSTFTAVGAFALTVGSSDTAELDAFNPGAYSAVLTSAEGTQSGTALLELYDADNAAPTNRMVNLSARGIVGINGNALEGGFVVGGTGSDTVLVRAIGPTLGDFGVWSPLMRPALTLYDSHGIVVASIEGWGGMPSPGPSAVFAQLQPASAMVMSSVGAFSLPVGSADCAMVLTLPAGAYTASVQGGDGDVGETLFEVYELQ